LARTDDDEMTSANVPVVPLLSPGVETFAGSMALRHG